MDASSRRFRKPSDRTFELIWTTFTKHSDYDRYTNSNPPSRHIRPLCVVHFSPHRLTVTSPLSPGSPSAASPWRITWRRIYRTSRTPRSNTRWKCCQAARKPSYLCSSGWRPWTTTTIGTRGSSSWPSSSARSIASSVSEHESHSPQGWGCEIIPHFVIQGTVIGFMWMQSTRQTGRYETGLNGVGLVNGIKR